MSQRPCRDRSCIASAVAGTAKVDNRASVRGSASLDARTEYLRQYINEGIRIGQAKAPADSPAGELCIPDDQVRGVGVALVEQLDRLADRQVVERTPLPRPCDLVDRLVTTQRLD